MATARKKRQGKSLGGRTGPWVAVTMLLIAALGVFNHHSILAASQQALPALVTSLGSLSAIAMLISAFSLLGGFCVWCLLVGFRDGTGRVTDVQNTDRLSVALDKNRTLIKCVGIVCVTLFAVTTLVVASLGLSTAQTVMTEQNRRAAECKKLYKAAGEIAVTTNGKFDGKREAEARSLLLRIDDFERTHLNGVPPDDAIRLLIAKGSLLYALRDQSGLAATLQAIEDRKPPSVWVADVEKLKILLGELAPPELPKRPGAVQLSTSVPPELIERVFRAEKLIDIGDQKSALKLLREAQKDMENTLAMDLQQPRKWWLNATALAALAASMLPATDQDYVTARDLARDGLEKSAAMLVVPMDKTEQFGVRRSRLQCLTVLQTLAVREGKLEVAAELSGQVLALAESIVDSLERIELMPELLTQYGNAEYIQESTGERKEIEQLIIRRKEFLEGLIKKGQTQFLPELKQAEEDLRNHKN